MSGTQSKNGYKSSPIPSAVALPRNPIQVHQTGKFVALRSTKAAGGETIEDLFSDVRTHISKGPRSPRTACQDKLQLWRMRPARPGSGRNAQLETGFTTAFAPSGRVYPSPVGSRPDLEANWQNCKRAKMRKWKPITMRTRGRRHLEGRRPKSGNAMRGLKICKRQMSLPADEDAQNRRLRRLESPLLAK